MSISIWHTENEHESVSCELYFILCLAFLQSRTAFSQICWSIGQRQQRNTITWLLGILVSRAFLKSYQLCCTCQWREEEAAGWVFFFLCLKNRSVFCGNKCLKVISVPSSFKCCHKDWKGPKGVHWLLKLTLFRKVKSCIRVLPGSGSGQGGAAPGPAWLSQLGAAWQSLLLVQSNSEWSLLPNKGQQGEKWGLLSQIFSL